MRLTQGICTAVTTFNIVEGRLSYQLTLILLSEIGHSTLKSLFGQR